MFIRNPNTGFGLFIFRCYDSQNKIVSCKIKEIKKNFCTEENLLYVIPTKENVYYYF